MNTPSNTRAGLQARSWFAVVLAYQSCERQYARLLAGFGFTIAQFEVLNAIDELGERATPALIAQRLLVTKGNVTGLIKRLGENELVRVVPNPVDGRSLLCRLGRGVNARLVLAKRASSAFITEQLAPFSDAELSATEAQMTRMRRRLEQIDTNLLVVQAKKAGRAKAA